VLRLAKIALLRIIPIQVVLKTLQPQLRSHQILKMQTQHNRKIPTLYQEIQESGSQVSLFFHQLRILKKLKQGLKHLKKANLKPQSNNQ
jgi:hypothetical protein